MNRRPLIVLEALQVADRPTGTGSASLELCRALASADRGFDFAVLASRPYMFEEIAGAAGWRVISCPEAAGGRLSRAFFRQWRLPRILTAEGADLLHCLQFLAPTRTGVPLVTSVYDLAWMQDPGTVETPRRWYYRWAVPRTLERSRALLVPSRATADQVAEHYPHWTAKVRVVPLGVPAWAARARTRLRPSSGERVGAHFLFVGAREPRKNIIRILDAYMSLLREDEDQNVPDLVLAGPAGWNDAAIGRKLKTAERTGKVRAVGYCPSDALSALYQEAVALVFPSLAEGFGLPILEAMAMGTPVLTANRGATAEVAGDAALLVDPCDVAAIAAGMKRLAEDAALRNRLRESGKKRVEQFDWLRAADATAAIYRDVLAETGEK